jgi:hypothetical protein
MITTSAITLAQGFRERDLQLHPATGFGVAAGSGGAAGFDSGLQCGGRPVSLDNGHYSVKLFARNLSGERAFNRLQLKGDGATGISRRAS